MAETHKDELGKRHGRWIVIASAQATPRYWLCRCDCGKERLVFGPALRNGGSISCGCFRDEQRDNGVWKAGTQPKDETGKRYGRWTVIAQAPNAERLDVAARWFCQCDCGVEKVVDGAMLRNGRSTSCGCYGVEQRNKANIGRRPAPRGSCKSLPTWRVRVKKRDHHVCQRCGKSRLSGRDEHAHHILLRRLFPEYQYVIALGLTLCGICHAQVSKAEKAALARTV